MSQPAALPLESLLPWLQANVPGLAGPCTATKFKGGQSNPTWLIQTPAERYVLRSKPSGKLLASAHAIDREYRVLGALHGSAIPVARPLAYCADESIIGSAFYVMAYVPGKPSWDPALPGHDTARRSAMYERVMDTLIALATVDVQAVGLGDYARPGNYFSRQVTRWTEQYRASEIEPIEAMDALIAWLPGALPADGARSALVHGDFRIDNLLWDADDHIVAVADWELSTLGDPLADIGYFCMALRLPRNPVLPGLAGLQRSALGIPEEAAMLERFARATGFDPSATWSFHLAFHFFRLAAIAQGVMKRAVQGNASNEQALAAGRMAPTIAALGVAAARL